MRLLYSSFLKNCVFYNLVYSNLLEKPDKIDWILVSRWAMLYYIALIQHHDDHRFMVGRSWSWLSSTKHNFLVRSVWFFEAGWGRCQQIRRAIPIYFSLPTWDGSCQLLTGCDWLQPKQTAVSHWPPPTLVGMDRSCYLCVCARVPYDDDITRLPKLG